jgi:uncharacterized protein YcaQ
MVPGMENVPELSADEARRLAVWAQGLSGPASARRAGGVGGMLRRLGAVQLDTISVLARSHELVPYARLGAVGRPAVEAAYWASPAVAFEYWAHAACLLPIEDWPLYGVVRRMRADDEHPRHHAGAAERAAVLAALRDRGPLTATQLGGAKRAGGWWEWSDVKVAAEDLFRWGEVVVTRREGWRRVYDLPERALPASVLGVEVDDATCRRTLLERSGRAMGVCTVADLAKYVSSPFSIASAQATVGDTCLVPVRVEGWRQPAWAHPDALAALSSGVVPARSRTTLLSPFDSLVWNRPRVERVFGMSHKLEAYVPRPLREHGYFAMPVLSGCRLVGRVDPARSGRTLVARHVTFGTGWGEGSAGGAAPVGRAAAGAVEAVATALYEAASWVGCDAVAVERVSPASLAAPVAAAVAAKG